MIVLRGEFFRLTMLLPCYYADYNELDSSGTANQTVCAEHESTGTCMWDVERQACTKDPSVVGLVFIAFGFGDCLGAFVLGWLSDGTGRSTPLRRKLVVTLGVLCYGGALALLMVFKKSEREILPRFPPKAWLPQEEKSISWLCFIIAALFGINDAAWNTQIYAALGSTAPKDGLHVFTIYQMFQQLGMVTGFCMPLLWPLESS
jgi:MFS family permease